MKSPDNSPDEPYRYDLSSFTDDELESLGHLAYEYHNQSTVEQREVTEAARRLEFAKFLFESGKLTEFPE